MLKAELTRAIYNQDWQSIQELKISLFDIFQKHDVSAQLALVVPDSAENATDQGKRLASDLSSIAMPSSGVPDSSEALISLIDDKELLRAKS